jgi:cell division protein FtsA
VLSEDERRLGAILMDIGGVAVIFHLQSRCSRGVLVVPMAGQAITEDLAIGLKTTISNAEYIKKQYGSAIAAEAIKAWRLTWKESAAGRLHAKHNT